MEYTNYEQVSCENSLIHARAMLKLELGRRVYKAFTLHSGIFYTTSTHLHHLLSSRLRIIESRDRMLYMKLYVKSLAQI
jgi:hypothetical protein